jgi:hypothetical protein
MQMRLTTYRHDFAIGAPPPDNPLKHRSFVTAARIRLRMPGVCVAVGTGLAILPIGLRAHSHRDAT